LLGAEVDVEILAAEFQRIWVVCDRPAVLDQAVLDRVMKCVMGRHRRLTSPRAGARSTVYHDRPAQNHPNPDVRRSTRRRYQRNPAPTAAEPDLVYVSRFCKVGLERRAAKPENGSIGRLPPCGRGSG